MRNNPVAAPSLNGLRTARVLLGTEIADEVETALEIQAWQESWPLLDHLSQAAMDRAHLSALPCQDKIGRLRCKFFPLPEFIRYCYDMNATGGLARAYAARWWTGIKSGLGY